MSKTLVINAGSSSIKFQEFEDEEVLISGVFEEIGNDNSKLKIKFNGKKEELVELFKNHKGALIKLIGILKDRNLFEGLNKVVHRVVHGGEKFKKTTLIDEVVLDELKKLIPLAPLHNPANIEGIEIMGEILPDVKQIAVFDTAFHSTIPESAYLYGVPYKWYTDYHVRRYGFHGSSHKYVIGEVIKLLGGVDDSRIISCHLGNGASICAALNGKSVDTSMGMTPLEGNLMGTRSGTIDPGIISYIKTQTGMGCEEITKILNKESGLKGLSELTSDMRPLEENMEKCEKSKRAMGVYLQRLTRLVGAHLAVLEGVDAIVFTGGAGEKSSILRKHIAKKLKFLGIDLDEEKNDNNFEGEITTKDSNVKIFVIQTNEELQMVRDAEKI